ncbi:class I SAM-dependent RNA methyltransferase [Gordonia aichiensis]|uniref:Putative RNA methyltransferase n=1 Tax=Gordonia aichiensis NBRC 108223 TaxID=1220583 RepID=L7KKI1_9ACTN|nr:TRAM domain-containing protein [Gordonia aichiensis]GAC48233.1 putative RNA methyltransferase [Gordonia aichiensis NBRC 108223]
MSCSAQLPETPAVTVRVDRPANGGEAVGRLDDGRVMFVRGAIPGETVEARVVDTRSESFWRAEAVAVRDPSPHRVDAICPAAAHGAGCCDLAFIEPGYARALKAQALEDVLVRVGHFTADRVHDWCADDTDPDAPPAIALRSLSDDATGWRVRTRLAIDGEGRCGQHRFHSGDVVVGADCVQPVAGLLDGLDERRFTPGAELAVVGDDAGRRHLTEIAPAAPPHRRGRRDRGRSAAQRRRRSVESRRATTVLEGDAFAAHRVGDRVWSIPVTGFWQAHRAAPTVYADTVAEFVSSTSISRSPTCWDLYGGAGILAGALVDTLNPGRVHIVDSDAAALVAAEEVFAAEGASVDTHRGEVAAVIESLPSPDVVVLDPPRTGAGTRVIDRIVAASPEVVVHVGCDAARFARDLALFTERGYAVIRMRAFDAFPLTHHVEAIALLVPISSAGV